MIFFIHRSLELIGVALRKHGESQRVGHIACRLVFLVKFHFLCLRAFLAPYQGRSLLVAEVAERCLATYLLYVDHRLHAGYEQLLVVVPYGVGIVPLLILVVHQNGIRILIQFVLYDKGVGQAQLGVVARNVVVARHVHLHRIVYRKKVGHELARFRVRINRHHVALAFEEHFIRIGLAPLISPLTWQEMRLRLVVVIILVQVVSRIFIRQLDGNPFCQVILGKGVSHLEGFLDDTTGHTAYHAHRRLVGQFHRRVTVVLVVDVFAVVIHDTSAVLERMVGQHGFHLMQTHGHRDAELALRVGGNDVALAVRANHAVYIELHALYRNGTAFVGHSTLYRERRLVYELGLVVHARPAQRHRCLRRRELM